MNIIEDVWDPALGTRMAFKRINWTLWNAEAVITYGDTPAQHKIHFTFPTDVAKISALQRAWKAQEDLDAWHLNYYKVDILGHILLCHRYYNCLEDKSVAEKALEAIVKAAKDTCRQPVEKHRYGRIQCVVSLRNKIVAHMAKLDAVESTTIVEEKLPVPPALMPNVIIRPSPSNELHKPAGRPPPKKKIKRKTLERKAAEEFATDATLNKTLALSRAAAAQWERDTLHSLASAKTKTLKIGFSRAWDMAREELALRDSRHR